MIQISEEAEQENKEGPPGWVCVPVFPLKF